MAELRAKQLKKTFCILVIETNPEQWLLIRETLAICFPEARPVWINDYGQVWPFLAKEIPKLILMELLPDRVKGFDTLKKLKMHATYQRIPVVILSDLEDEPTIGESYSSGAASYIHKPTLPARWVNCFYNFRAYWWVMVTLPPMSK